MSIIYTCTEYRQPSIPFVGECSNVLQWSPSPSSHRNRTTVSHYNTIHHLYFDRHTFSNLGELLLPFARIYSRLVRINQTITYYLPPMHSFLRFTANTTTIESHHHLYSVLWSNDLSTVLCTVHCYGACKRFGPPPDLDQALWLVFRQVSS